MGYVFLAVLSMLSFGVYYFLVKFLSLHVPSSVIALIGNTVAFLVIYLYLYSTKTPVLPKRRIHIVYSLVISVPVVIGVLALYMAIARGPVSIVMPIIGINSMVTVILGISILRERVTVRKGFGVLLAVAAIVLLNL
ncbi:EamA family transporter [Chloroflexota bacterium]